MVDESIQALADQESQTRIPAALQQLELSTAISEPIPFIHASEVLADTGLQVAFSTVDQQAQVSARSIEANWVHMQECLNQVSVAPLVLVREDGFAAMTADDIVIHSIEGYLVASVSLTAVPVVQIGVSDLLSSDESNGVNLRAIMGRLIWSSADLAVRDYPYTCATTVVD